MHQEQAEWANKAAQNRKQKANALLDVTNHNLCMWHGPKKHQSQLEDVIEEMLHLHETDPNQQPRPDVWPSSDFDIPDDVETEVEVEHVDVDLNLTLVDVRNSNLGGG